MELELCSAKEDSLTLLNLKTVEYNSALGVLRSLMITMSDELAEEQKVSR